MRTLIIFFIFSILIPCYSNANGENLLKALMLLKTAQTWNISTKKEIEIGKNYHDQLIKHYHILKDKKKTKWAQNIFNKVVAYAKREKDGELHYSLTIIDDKTVNAFAIPGGFVQVFTGLLDKISSDDELACILGHEITHIELKHSLKQMKSDTMLSTLILLGSKSGEARSGLNAIKNLSMLSYSRQDEEEADDNGTKLAAKAGYNAYAMVDFMEKLMSLDKRHVEPWKEIFMTHPLSNIRAQTLIWKIQDNDFNYNTDKPIFLSYAESREISFVGNDILNLNIIRDQGFSFDGMQRKKSVLINTKKDFRLYSKIIPISNDRDYIFSIVFTPLFSAEMVVKLIFFDKNKERIFPDIDHHFRVLGFRQLQKFKIHAYKDIPKSTSFLQVILSSDANINSLSIEKIALFDHGHIDKKKSIGVVQTPGFKIEGLDKLNNEK